MPGKVSDKISDKQELFCREYIVDMNCTNAALKAGFSAKNASVQGWAMKEMPKLKKRINELIAQKNEQTGIRAIDLVNWTDDIRQKATQAGKYDAAIKAVEVIGKLLGHFEKDNTQKQIVLQPPTINVFTGLD